MPVKIPSGLPAWQILDKEAVPLIRERDAIHQDIRPLRIALVNLMPDKIRTETQLMRVLGATPLQVEIDLVRTESYKSKHTAENHLLEFYTTWREIRDRRYDGMIVTGAPVAHMAYEDVAYWDELTDILEWSRTHVYSSFFICWGAQAALYYYYGIEKHPLPEKLFGVYKHKPAPVYEPLIAGFDDIFDVPVSRHTIIRKSDLARHADLEILAEAEESGPCLIQEPDSRRVYMFHHLEYDRETLKREYERDKNAGQAIAIPENYFPDDDPRRTPVVSWRAHRNLLFGNWINIVYQGTPYDLNTLEPAA